MHNDYERRTGGIWQKKIFGRTDEIDILIEFFKGMETEYIQNGRSRNEK